MVIYYPFTARKHSITKWKSANDLRPTLEMLCSPDFQVAITFLTAYLAMTASPQAVNHTCNQTDSNVAAMENSIKMLLFVMFCWENHLEIEGFPVASCLMAGGSPTKTSDTKMDCDKSQSSHSPS